MWRLHLIATVALFAGGTIASLPNFDHLNLPLEDSPYDLSIHSEEYLPSALHQPVHRPPPPSSPSHSSAYPTASKAPLLKRIPIDPSHCALIVPNHRPPLRPVEDSLTYLNNNYLIG